MFRLEQLAMQKIAAASNSAIALTAQLLDSEAKRGLLVGMTLALAFIWGP